MVENSLFAIDDKTQKVTALGIELTAKAKDIRILVDGKDLLDHMLYDRIEITTTIHKTPEPAKAQELK